MQQQINQMHRQLSNQRNTRFKLSSGEWRNYISSNPGSAADRVGGPMASMLQHSMLTSAIMTSYRLWETGRDCRSICKLRREFPEDEVRDSILGQNYENQRLEAIDAFFHHVDEYVRSDHHLAIGVSRAEGFAHSVEQARLRNEMVEPRVANFAELEMSLTVAKQALNQADLALRSNQTGFEFLHEDYERLYRQGIPRLFT